MKVWVITTGEPIPSMDVRPHRAGVLSEMLSHKSNEVVWWTSTFDHQNKEYIFNKNTKITTKDNICRVHLHSPVSYKKNLSLSRLINHYLVAEDFLDSASLYDLPDIIFCSFPTIDLAYASVKFGIQNNIPVVVDVRDLWPDIFLQHFPFIFKPFLRFALSFYFLKAKYIFKNAFGIIGVSKKYLDFGLSYAQRKISERDKVFPLGYDPGVVINKNRDVKNNINYGVNRKCFNILFIGTFGRTYDLSTVIKVAHKMEETHPSVNFIFIGDGEKRGNWEGQSKNLKNIIFTGWLGKNEIHYISSISSVGLMAYSENASQGLPNKLFEYMSFGLPILSSLQTETKDLIKEKIIGLSYTANNPDDLFRKISMLLENQKLLNEMRRNSISTFKENFDSKIIYENLIKYLREIILKYND